MGVTHQRYYHNKMNSRVLVSLLALAVTDRVTGNKDHDSFCRDLTDYGDLTYINETINVCTSELKKTCVDKTEEMCMDVTHMDCDVELFTDCAMDWTTHDVVESKPTTLTKHLPTCTKHTRPEEHEKVHYDCKDVTWEECEPIPVTVEWEVPYMECITTPHSYLSYENVTRPVMADTMECRVEKRVVCKPRKENKCASITYTTCSEVPKVDCKPKEVPCPSKEKIHKQWCLYDQDNDITDGITEIFQTENQQKSRKLNKGNILSA